MSKTTEPSGKRSARSPSHESWVGRLRAFLTRNKIFLEIAGFLAVTAALGAWMAVLTSQSVQLSKTQTMLLERQTELIEASEMPQFYLELANSPFETAAERADDRDLWLSICNVGSPVAGFEVDVDDYILLRVSEDREGCGPSVHLVDIYIPCEYFRLVEGEGADGEVIAMLGPEVSQRLQPFEGGLQDWCTQVSNLSWPTARGTISVAAKLFALITIRYMDLLGIDRSVAFEVNSQSGDVVRSFATSVLDAAEGGLTPIHVVAPQTYRTCLDSAMVGCYQVDAETGLSPLATGIATFKETLACILQDYLVAAHVED